MNLADAVALTLRDWDTRFVFGVSGANIEHLHDAIARHGGSELQAILTRSEAGAAFMADSRARIHRTLGVCCATSGGGMMNLTAGVAEAYQESVPMLAIIGQPPTHLEGAGAFQDSSGRGRSVDAVAMWRAMSKFTARIDDPSQFWATLDEAVAAALGGRQGPAVLLVPRDMWAAPVPDRPETLPHSLDAYRTPVCPEPSALADLHEALRDARHPVFLLGTGVERSGAQQAVRRFVEAAGIPVFSTMANPGVFPPTHLAYLGMVGVAGHPSAHAWCNTHADLIVAVGTGLNIMARGPLAPALSRARVAVIDIDPGAAASIVPDALRVRGDAGETFRALSKLHLRRPFRHNLPDVIPTRYASKLANPADLPCPTTHDAGDTLLQSEAIALLQPHLPAPGHLLFDAGNCAATALHHLSVPESTTATIALGMGGMGYAVAGAIGAQLGAAPGTRTMVLAGDGAFLMEGFEVHTAVALQLPIVFVVFNNQKHGMCVTRQQAFFDGRIEATTYPHLDVATVARGLGGAHQLAVHSVGTPEALHAALTELAEHQGPAVLELRLSREEIPPFTPLLGADAETFTPTRTRTEAAA